MWYSPLSRFGVRERAGVAFTFSLGLVPLDVFFVLDRVAIVTEAGRVPIDSMRVFFWRGVVELGVVVVAFVAFGWFTAPSFRGSAVGAVGSDMASEWFGMGSGGTRVVESSAERRRWLS